MSYHLSAGHLALCHVVNTVLVIALCSQKRLDEGLNLQVLEQKPLISSRLYM